MTSATAASSPIFPHGAAIRTSGVIRVRERVIDKVVRQVSADAIGVPREHVNTEAAEWGGGLAVRVSAKLPIPDLADAAAISSETPILDRARYLQSTIAEQLSRLTGREVTRVSFTVTGAIISERKRVR